MQQDSSCVQSGLLTVYNCLCGLSGGHPAATEELRYGLRLSIVCLPADPKLLTPDALEVVGPKALGLGDASYQTWHALEQVIWKQEE